MNVSLGFGTSRTGLSFPSDIRSTCLEALEFNSGFVAGEYNNGTAKRVKQYLPNPLARHTE